MVIWSYMLLIYCKISRPIWPVHCYNVGSPPCTSMYYVKYVLVKSPESTLAGAKDGKFDRKFQISARLCQEIQDTQRDSTSSTSQPWLRKVGIGKHPISSNIIQSSNHQQYQQSNNNPIIQPYHPIIQSSNNPIIQSSIQSSCHGSHRHRGNPLPGWGFAAAFHVANPGVNANWIKMPQDDTTWHHTSCNAKIATGFSDSLAYFASPQVVWNGAHQSDHQKNLSQDEPRTSALCPPEASRSLLAACCSAHLQNPGTNSTRIHNRIQQAEFPAEWTELQRKYLLSLFTSGLCHPFHILTAVQLEYFRTQIGTSATCWFLVQHLIKIV